MKTEKIKLHSTTDGQVWTNEFINTFKNVYTDAYYKTISICGESFKEWVFGWFCNAIQTGIDLTNIQRDRRYVYILQSNSGAIVKVWSNGFEPSEDEMDVAYSEYNDLCGTASAAINCTLYRWNKYEGIKCWNGKALAETIYNWK